MEENKKIILYTVHCPKCNILEKKLALYGITYEICEDIETMQALNMQTAPMLEVDGRLMNFSEAIKWLKTMPEVK